MSEYGYSIDEFGGSLPVQAMGTCGPSGRNEWYFRARGEHWRLDVYEPGTVGRTEPVFRATAKWGAHHDAGWMPSSIALALIESALEVYTISAESDDEDRERREREKVEDRERRYYVKYPDAPLPMEDR